MAKKTLCLFATAIQITPTLSQIFNVPISLAAATVDPVPPTATTTTCTTTRCEDYVNACGKWYGGCFAACSGYSTPTFTPPPGCSLDDPITTTTTPITTMTSPTEGEGGGGGKEGEITSATQQPCTDRIVCIDYMNTCSVKYGGCFDICPGKARPTFTDPGCLGRDEGVDANGDEVVRSPKTFTKVPVTTRRNACGVRCEESVDGCGNFFGPGCYSSCTGQSVVVPTYTRPYCEVSAEATGTTTATAV